MLLAVALFNSAILAALLYLMFAFNDDDYPGGL